MTTTIPPEATDQVDTTLLLWDQLVALRAYGHGWDDCLKSVSRLIDATPHPENPLRQAQSHKSEFLVNMSHELRTPLTTLLVLAEQLELNGEHHLSAKEVEYASVIRASGTDLLSLLNDILDLAKVESGTVTIVSSDVTVTELRDTILRTFKHVAEVKGLDYQVSLDCELPAIISTDGGRLRQVLKNLLANAFKFTEQGGVVVSVAIASGGWSAANETLNAADSVIMFRVTDTGIGIAEGQQKSIFEAFAQADGSTARQFGGTGLGLSISRELVRLLGGEITLTSAVGAGSVFTVYLPTRLAEVAAADGRP